MVILFLLPSNRDNRTKSKRCEYGIQIEKRCVLVEDSATYSTGDFRSMVVDVLGTAGNEIVQWVG